MHSTSKPLLQKLLQHETSSKAEVLTFNESLRLIKSDIEGLLNSFAVPIKWPAKLSHLNNSILNFGLPNYLSQDYGTADKKAKLCSAIAKCIEKNEPRLLEVKVYMQDDDLNDLILQIRIDAKVNWHEQKKSVTLQSDWDPLNMSFTLL
jgi:type VI secretion system protein ImpF